MTPNQRVQGSNACAPTSVFKLYVPHNDFQLTTNHPPESLGGHAIRENMIKMGVEVRGARDLSDLKSRQRFQLAVLASVFPKKLLNCRVSDFRLRTLRNSAEGHVRFRDCDGTCLYHKIASQHL